jgi:predicted MarR family transcription regulator
MSAIIRVQESHSRNSHDWKMVRTATGRHAFMANEKGVALRIGLLVEFLASNHQSSVADMTAMLQGVHRSYNENDVSQPMRQMRKHGIVQVIGRGKEARYSLTTNGRRIWEHATLKWV